MVSAAFQTEMARLQDAHPKTKVEFIDTLGNVTDISAYYASGAEFDQMNQRAVDEIQAGSFDITVMNHDNKFSEYDTASLLYGIQYHGARLRISEGFVLSDGSEEYAVQAVGYIDELDADPTVSQVTFRCRDIIKFLMDQTLNPKPIGLLPVANASNIGTGSIASVVTRPFLTKNQTWTLTCTTAGGDSTGQFSVVGSVSGNVGTLTSGTEFSTGTGPGGVRFTLSAGTVNWALGDVFTFTTYQHPEWSAVNAGKIVWSILTGYDWDTNTQKPWSASVFAFDHTQSTSNTQLDYSSFVTAIANIDTIGSFALTGFVNYDEAAITFIQTLTSLFIGSLATGADGRLKLASYIPGFLSTVSASFSDATKNTQFGYARTIDEVINYVSVTYKATSAWEFSDDSTVYDGQFVASSAASITKYGALAQAYTFRWFSSNGEHVAAFAERLVDKYAEPPLNLIFAAGGDAILSSLGDYVSVTDSKYKLSNVLGTIVHLTKKLDTNPIEVDLVVKRDSDLETTWGFLGSSANEGDGLSPQSASWDTASATDLNFCYLSQSGGGGPSYRMF